MRCRLPEFLAAILAAVLVGAQCTPSVRYTRPSSPLKSSPQSRETKTTRAPVSKNGSFSRSRLRQIVNQYLGVPYRRGGTSAKGMDCSGLVFVVFQELNGTTLPRTTRKLSRKGRAVALRFAKPGDLVFFRGGNWNTINHVGIYLGNKQFAHASSSSGVMISNLDEPYFKKRYGGTRRLF